ncbi:MAG: leucine dehydrogenase [Acidobacteriota bacterium]|nr:leucine dehydrogenase [Acidobacteriota bacterium]
MPTLDQLVASWDGNAVVMRFDAVTGTWIFICLHDNTLGASTGGSRMAVYPSPEDGLVDAMRLSEGMTNKWAAVDLPFGGGKAVLALQRPLSDDERHGLLYRYGDLVESLQGAFRTGEDLGTSSDDMLRVAERTRHVHGFDSDGNKVDPSPFTAHGVLSGMRAAVEVVFGSPSLAGRTVLVEGVGNVGTRLAEKLNQEGASLILADIDAERAQSAARRLQARIVAPDEVAGIRCDIYAPCAIGATVNRMTIPTLACRIIAGSANNQLGESGDAERLSERGIVYVPDFIINAGGAMAFAEIDRDLDSPQELFSAVARIGETTGTILREAIDRSETTLAAAKRRVEATLARARAKSAPAPA